MNKEFQQIEWSEQLDADWRQLLTLAVAEDLGDVGDWTTASLVPEDAEGRAAVVARAQGVVAGLPAIPATLAEFESELIWEGLLEDGAIVQPGQGIGALACTGSADAKAPSPVTIKGEYTKQYI